jgi:hypothetical protein
LSDFAPRDPAFAARIQASFAKQGLKAWKIPADLLVRPYKIEQVA